MNQRANALTWDLPIHQATIGLPPKGECIIGMFIDLHGTAINGEYIQISNSDILLDVFDRCQFLILVSNSFGWFDVEP